MVRGKGKVTVTDNGWNALMKTLTEVSGGRFVRVGILGNAPTREYEIDPVTGKGRGPSLTNVELGTVHEFGSRDDHVPERSFLRSTLEEKKQDYFDLIRTSIEKALKRKGKGINVNWDRLFGRLGELVLGDVKGTIQRGIPPELSDATKAGRRNKTTFTPLHDTGQLIGSLNWEVKKRP